MTRRAVISGRGVVSPAGIGVGALWQAIRSGTSCVAAEERLDLDGLPLAKVSARFPKQAVTEITVRYPDRRSDAEALLWEAIDQALGESRLEPKYAARTAVLTTQLPESGFELSARGPGYGELLRSKTASGAVAREGLGSTLVSDLSRRLASDLTLLSLQATCATGLRLICEAARQIQLGRADRVVVAVLSRPVDAVHFAAFGRALALSRWDGAPVAASRPFDQQRSGFVFGEAAGALVIEAEELARARQAPCFGRVLGWGLAMNSEHFLRTSLRHMVRVIRGALKSAELEPKDIGLLDAMGSSTPIGDADEARAIHRVFGEHLDSLRVSANKAVVGYSSQASAVVDVIACTEALREGVCPPVPTCETQEPDLELPILRRAAAASTRYVLKHCFGMGGHYGALALEKMES